MMIFLILVLAFILRIINLNQSLWLDEAINVLATKNYSFLGMVTEYAKADFHPPGFFMISWIWNNFFGIGETTIRIPSVIFGILTIYIIYLIGQKLHSKSLGLLSALLLAINPLHIYYSQEARMYALATLAVSINIFLFIKLIKRERVNLIYLVISNLLILASDYVSYFIFPSLLTFLLILKKKEILKKWFISLIVAIAAGIWWIPVFFSQLYIGSVTSAKLPTWKLIAGSFDLKVIPLTFVKFIIGRISYPDKLIYAISLLPVSALFSFLILRGIKFIGKSGRILLTAWISIPIILAGLISLIVPIYSYFRLQFVLPAFVTLIALGIISFKHKLRYSLLTVVVSIQFFSSIAYLTNPAYQRENWKGVVSFLESQNKDALILFESSGTLPPFDYYAKKKLNAKGALKDFPARSNLDVIDVTNFQNSKDIYLIDYLVDISDPERVVKVKLNELGYRISETKDFHGVGFVYHYVKE